MIRKHILSIALLCAGATCNQANSAQMQTQEFDFFMKESKQNEQILNQVPGFAQGYAGHGQDDIIIIAFDALEQDATLTQYFDHILNISIKDLGRVSLKEIERTYKKLKECKTQDDLFNAYLKDATGLSPLFYKIDETLILDATQLELNEKLADLLKNSPKKTYLCIDGSFTVTPEDKNVICEVRYFDELQNVALFSDIIVEILQDTAVEKLVNTKDHSKEEIKKLTYSILNELIQKLPVGHPLWTFWKDKIVSHTDKFEKFLTALSKNHPEVIEQALVYINEIIDDADDNEANTREIEQEIIQDTAQVSAQKITPIQA
ncbi:MAG: hypothetical protein ABH827_01830 [bacterium]